MSANPTLPPVPSTVLEESTGPLTKAFGHMFVTLHAQAQSIVDSFRVVREAKSKMDERLANGSTPEAVAYRNRKAEADAKLESIRTDEKYAADRATIAELQAKIDEDIKARSTKVREVVKALKDAAVKAEIGDIVSDVDPAALAKQLTDVNTQLTGAKNLLLPENPALKGWRPLGVGAVTGTAPEDKKWNPRLDGAKVNGADVPHTGANVTMSDVAKAAGIKDKNHLVNGLEEFGCGGLRVLPTDKWTTFDLTVGTSKVNISVIGRPTKSDSADTDDDGSDETTDTVEESAA